MAKKQAQDRTRIKKKEYKEAHKKVWCNVALACKKAGISRTQYYAWLRDDSQFRKDIEIIRMEIIDTVESQVIVLIAGRDRKTEEVKEMSETEWAIAIKTYLGILSRIAKNETGLASDGWDEKKNIVIDMRVQYEERITVFVDRVSEAIQMEITDDRTVKRIANRIRKLRIAEAGEGVEGKAANPGDEGKD